MDQQTREAELQAAYERGQRIGAAATRAVIVLIPKVMMWRAARRGDTAATIAWSTVVVTDTARRIERRAGQMTGEIVLGAVRRVERR